MTHDPVMVGVNEVSNMKDYLPLIGVVIGGILAIVGGFLSNLWFEYKRDSKLRETLALAFEGEISAILEIIERRRYIEILRQARDRIVETGIAQVTFFRARRDYFNVFESNVGQIGLLRPPLPRLIARFYTQANAILEDMERFENAHREPINLNAAVQAYDNVIAIFEDTVDVENQIINEVSRHYN